jgi:hypothetical protein
LVVLNSKKKNCHYHNVVRPEKVVILHLLFLN